MAWIPSHQTLRNHPKLKRAARIANVPPPTMIGHLHLLWWWALDHAPDGDLSRYDAYDIADGAMWEGDPEVFMMALRDSGPRGSAGFLDGDLLHDWCEYGGKYGRRVESARKAAAARWHPKPNATAMRPHSEGMTAALQPQSVSNAEESREDKKVKPLSVADATDAEFEQFWNTYPRHHDTRALGGGGVKKTAKDAWRRLTTQQQQEAAAALDTYTKVCRPDGQKPKHAERFLKNDAWKPYLPDARTSTTRTRPDECPECRQSKDGHDQQLHDMLVKAG